MPQSMFDSPELSQARNAYQGATAASLGAQQAGMSLPDMLRETLTKKFSSDNPLYQNRESALQGYLNQTTQAPLAVTPQSAGGQANVVFNPLEQANLIQQRRSFGLAPLTTANDLLNLTTGGIPNIIESTGRAYQGYQKGLQNQASLAQQAYENLFQEAQQRANESYRQQQLALQQARSGGGGGGLNLSQLLKYQKEIGGQTQGLDEALTEIQRARQTLGEGGLGKTGILAGLLSRIGFPTPQNQQLQSALATVNKRIFETAGKTLSKTERDILKARIPQASEQTYVIKTKLDELQNELLRKRAQLLQGGGLESLLGLTGSSLNFGGGQGGDDFTPE